MAIEVANVTTINLTHACHLSKKHQESCLLIIIVLYWNTHSRRLDLFSSVPLVILFQDGGMLENFKKKQTGVQSSS